MEQLARDTRKREYADWEGLIHGHPLARCSDDENSPYFIQFDLRTNINGEMQRIIGWAHHDLINVVKNGPKHLFIDCTFKSVPKSFFQCLIIVVHDPNTEVYTPVFYVLLQKKSQAVYEQALTLCMNSCDNKLIPISVTTDFEQALMNAIQEQFPKIPVIGCEFHWKQAIKRKLEKLGIPQDMIHKLICSSGPLQILTMIEICEIEQKGIPYVGRLIHKTI
jgi:hypothetical protein